MDILYLLIPLSSVLVLAVVGVFAWALHGGQFDDLEREGQRILGAPGEGGLDSCQGLREAEAKESTRLQ